MFIKKLDKEIIQLINNTQIISSIYSVIKELVENSLDAQAKNIEVNLVNNGLTLIEVKDNGDGIFKEDAQYMGLSSCTSKISNFNDLDQLSTYGFRGGGLTAICQVSDVTVCTKTATDKTGICYTLNYQGQVINEELSHGLTGTIVRVYNIFKNMPVRRNILNNKKKINQEIKAVEILLKTYAICKPTIKFIFRVNSNTIFTKYNYKDTYETLKCILGTQIVSKLICIEQNYSQIEMKLFVPKKDIIDCDEIVQVGLQFIIINDRPIKSNIIEKQIISRISAYFHKNNSSYRKFIFCLILRVHCSLIDINLEPNKDKIFLQNEGAVLNLLDKSLLNLYELNNFQILIQNENIRYNSIIKETEINNEEPICKKRKINNSKINKINFKEQPNCDSNPQISDGFLKNKNKSSLFHHIYSISDPDSNNIIRLNEDKTSNKIKEYFILDMKKKYLRNNISELFDFDKDILKEDIKTLLSQLPCLDLREDFNWNDVANKALVTTTTGSSFVEQVSQRKQQLSKLQNCITFMYDKEINEKNENNQQEDSKLIDFNKDIKETNNSEKLISMKDAINFKKNEYNWKNDPAQTKLSFAENNLSLYTQHSAFTKYCITVRTDILKQYPKFTPTEVASHMNKLWKLLSPDERQFYHDLKNKNLFNLFISQKTKKIKYQATQIEKNNNKKQFVNMLGNMKTNKTEIKTESVILRSFKSWNVNISLVTTKFKMEKKKKNKLIIGSLNSLLWIIKLSSKLFVFDLTELQAQLNVNHFDMSQINHEYVENLVNQWFIKKNDMSIFHTFHLIKT